MTAALLSDRAKNEGLAPGPMFPLFPERTCRTLLFFFLWQTSREPIPVAVDQDKRSKSAAFRRQKA